MLIQFPSGISTRINAWLTHKRVRLLVKVMLVLICVMTCTGFTGHWSWVLDLTSHFRLQYMMVQVLFAGLFIFMRRPLWLLTMLIFSIINVVQILPFYVPPPKIRAHGQSIQVLHLNVFRFNGEHQRVLNYIEKTHPDFISLAEFDANWIKATQDSAVLKQFPYHQIDATSRLALFSRYPLKQLDFIPVAPGQSEGRDALIIARFELDDELVALALMHPKPPILPYLVQRQQAHLTELKTRLPTFPKRFILLGDFNMTSWSAVFHRLTHDMGVRDTRLGLGLQLSWPVHSPLMMLPIDHALVTEGWVVLSRHTGEWVGSDHLPVHLTLALNKV